MRTLSKGLLAALVATALFAARASAGGGYLGVQINEASGGVQILSVRDATAAAAGGLAAGDLVTAIGDRSITTADDLQAALGKLSAGSTVTIKVKRGDAAHDLTVTLGQRPDSEAGASPVAATRSPHVEATPVPTPPAAPAPPAVFAPGSVAATPLIPMPAEAAHPVPSAPPTADKTPAAPMPGIAMLAEEPPRKGGFLGITLEGGEGADNTIGSVVDDSPAAKASLRAGDVIVAIDGKDLNSSAAISEYLTTKAKGDSVEITVERDGKRKLRTAKLAGYGEIAFAATAVEPMAPGAPAEAAKSAKAEMEEKVSKATVRTQRAERVKAQEGEAAQNAKAKQDKGAAKAAKAQGGRGWLGIFFNSDDGCVVESVVPNGPAENAGIQAGDKIQAVSGTKIESTEALIAALAGKAGKDVAILVERDGKATLRGVTLGDVPSDMEVVGEAPSAEAQEKVAEARKSVERAVAQERKARDKAVDETNDKIEKEIEAARKAADKATASARKAAEKAMKNADEAAAKAEKRARAEAEKAMAESKRAHDESMKAHDESMRAHADAMKEHGKSGSGHGVVETTRQRWFVPVGKKLTLRVDEKDHGFWLTTGDGSDGIFVPRDGSTGVSIEGKGDGIEIVVGAGGAHSMIAHSGDDIFDVTVGVENPHVVVGKPGKSNQIVVVGKGATGEEVEVRSFEMKTDSDSGSVQHRFVVPSRKDDDDGDDDDDDDKKIEIRVEGANGLKYEAPNVQVWRGGAGSNTRTVDLSNDHVIHLRKGDVKDEVIEVEKDGMHVLPLPRMGGGGITIHNNGGTVIIGDAAARAFLNRDARKDVSVVVDRDAPKERRLEALNQLGYINGGAKDLPTKVRKAEKKADQKAGKKAEKKEKGSD